MIDNIIIGTPLATDDELGIQEHETTERLTFAEARARLGSDKVFLPAVLREFDIVQSSNQVKAMQKQRDNNPKFTPFPEQNLWRYLEQPEMTKFKIGKRIFWLIVGEDLAS